MDCSHFVVVCYQVAGLEPVVSAAPVGVGVHDKKGRYDPAKIPVTHRSFLNQYEIYKAGDDANSIDPKSQPGVIFWKFDVYGDISAFKCDSFITKGMKVDSKLIMPKDLHDCLIDDKDNWSKVGMIPAVPPE